MSKIRIKYFGPIKEGFQENNGWMDIKKITVFIGSQGSGKSTVAKIISTLTWIEKALIRGDFKEKNLNFTIFKKHCAYQNIDNYFSDENIFFNGTIIEYEGKAYSISYKNKQFSVVKKKENGYLFPKIMYVPGERNFVSVVDKPTTLKKLPSPLYTFIDEFENAKMALKDGLDLPIGNTKFEFQKLNNTAWIVGDSYKIKLSEASSGFQSFVPLYIVSRYLSLSMDSEKNSSIQEISIEEEKRLKKEIEKILSNKKLTEEVKKASLELLSSRFKYSSFINIVEEPEQNLFPTSQRQMLNSLIEFTNMAEGNKLIVTTHSPYIINYLTLAIQGHSLLEKIEASDTLKARLNKVVPTKSCISASNTVVYELDENGVIKRLADYNGIPSDKNFLNQSLAEGNRLFDTLLEIEEEL